MEKTRSKYCLKHGRQELIHMDGQGEEFHFLNYHYDHQEVEPLFVLGSLESLDKMACYGPFSETPPPPPSLTDEEWEAIFSSEEQTLP